MILREKYWRTYRDNKAIKQNGNKIIQLSKATKEEIGRLEAVWCHCKPQKRD